MATHIRFPAASNALSRSIIGLASLALGWTAMSGTAVATDKLVLQLHREPQFEFAGYYAALWKGFYREAGLEVEIKPGASPGAAAVDSVREVTERRAQFGTGTAQLMIRAAQGLPLLLLAPIFQHSGAAVYYRADSDFASPRALLGAKLARLPASNILDLELRTALDAQGAVPDKLKAVTIEPGQAITALAERRVDAVVGSAWELPWQARERSIALKSFAFAGWRPEFYGDALFTLQSFANANPSTARRFRQASLKGWQYALQHQDEIAARIVAELPVKVPVSDAAGFARYQSEVAKELARFPEIPLGQSNPERWAAVQQSLIASGAMAHPVALGAFVYDADVFAWGFGSKARMPAIAAAALFALLVAAGWFLRRRMSNADKPRVAGSKQVRPRGPGWLDRVRPSTWARPHLERLRMLTHTGFTRASITRQVAASIPAGRLRTRITDLNATLTALEPSVGRCLPRFVTYQLSLLPELWPCEVNRYALTGSILNLVAEAAADMPKGGELVVGTRQCAIDRARAAEFPGSAPGDYVRVTVKDGGRGLSPEQLEKIFYPNRTVRPAVAAAWKLTRRLRGFAAVESAEGVGTAVHLHFPRAAGRAQEPVAEYVHAQAAE